MEVPGEPGGGGRGSTPLYKLARYVQRKTIWLFEPF